TPLQLVWAAIALLGLVAVGVTATQVDGGAFLDDIFANAATTTVTIDLLILGVAVIVFLVVEASRLGMRRPWLWAIVAVPLPGAFLVPLFFVFRERRLQSEN
ncbi:MAG: hypothetical protein JWM12_592, partial [Ilumatobacteraceae bacterium]|nr:hypothetical protein [Ilumatobacteraceae bacterium]